jgi:hypothetical protein
MSLFEMADSLLPNNPSFSWLSSVKDLQTKQTEGNEVNEVLLEFLSWLWAFCRILRFLGYLLLNLSRRIKQKETKVTKFWFSSVPPASGRSI